MRNEIFSTFFCILRSFIPRIPWLAFPSWFLMFEKNAEWFRCFGVWLSRSATGTTNGRSVFTERPNLVSSGADCSMGERPPPHSAGLEAVCGRWRFLASQDVTKNYFWRNEMVDCHFLVASHGLHGHGYFAEPSRAKPSQADNLDLFKNGFEERRKAGPFLVAVQTQLESERQYVTRWI